METSIFKQLCWPPWSTGVSIVTVTRVLRFPTEDNPPALQGGAFGLSLAPRGHTLKDSTICRASGAVFRTTQVTSGSEEFLCKLARCDITKGSRWRRIQTNRCCNSSLKKSAHHEVRVII